MSMFMEYHLCNSNEDNWYYTLKLVMENNWWSKSYLLIWDNFNYYVIVKYKWWPLRLLPSVLCEEISNKNEAILF